ncbi:MAG TPA: molybdenum ABC transporter ATP-binding protein [Candidatus Sulfotelmatobacter sp.]|jgi:molybdate transport system ATP-binding protein|nr:molybdenum ABC transporter ATP-binding protein [Candidatus Sulfotelmatobacter sp.]
MTASHTDETAAIALSPQLSSQNPSADSALHAQFRKRFATPNQQFVLDAEFHAAPGFTILFGPSGAGKTTVLDCVAGLTQPDSGRIAIGTRVLFDAAQRVNLAVEKRRIGYVFQTLALFPHLTVEKNVQYGLMDLPASERVARAAAILQAFRIAHLAQRYPREISGGENQRAALARTLVTDPAVLLLDEPLAALDFATKSKIIDDLRQWNHTHRIPILYVTHSREEVFALGERVLILDAGRIVAQGTPHEVIAAPLQETVAQLIGFENIFDATVESIHPERGTMTCRIGAGGIPVVLETPLVRGGVGSALRVGIRAGDILLATAPPVGLSARNVIPGRIASLEQRDVIVSARVKCRVEMEVHLTLAARDSLQLVPGREVWLVIKTHSCHLMQPR